MLFILYFFHQERKYTVLSKRRSPGRQMRPITKRATHSFILVRFAANEFPKYFLPFCICTTLKRGLCKLDDVSPQLPFRCWLKINNTQRSWHLIVISNHICTGHLKITRVTQPSTMNGQSGDQWPLLLTWFNFNPSMDK